MPCFRGCEQKGLAEQQACSGEEMVKFVSAYLVYPELAKMTGVEGTVFVTFVVDENGMVQNPSVLTDIGAGCGEAALDVLREMPLWQPGQHAGQAVKVRLNLPIHFYLRATERDRTERYNLTWGSLREDTVTEAELADALNHAVRVRGPEGDVRFVDELEFSYEKKGRIVTGSGRGSIAPGLKKVVERARPGGLFTIRAAVQENGEFVLVARSFRVVE